MLWSSRLLGSQYRNLHIQHPRKSQTSLRVATRPPSCCLPVALGVVDYMGHTWSCVGWLPEHWRLWVFSSTRCFYLNFANINGWNIVCWFASDRTRLLVNFIPRWIIIFIIIALYLRLTYILLRIQKQLESTEEDTTIILSGHHHMSRQIDLQQKDPQTNSYPHTSDSRSATANVQRSGPTSKLKKVRSSNNGSPTGWKPKLNMYDFYKVAVRMMMYPVLYMLIWTIPTAIRIYQGTSGHSTPLGINCVDKVGPDSLNNITFISKTNGCGIDRPVLLFKVWQIQSYMVRTSPLMTREQCCWWL